MLCSSSRLRAQHLVAYEISLLSVKRRTLASQLAPFITAEQEHLASRCCLQVAAATLQSNVEPACHEFASVWTIGLLFKAQHLPPIHAEHFAKSMVVLTNAPYAPAFHSKSGADCLPSTSPACCAVQACCARHQMLHVTLNCNKPVM